jgi:hypothetical protein
MAIGIQDLFNGALNHGGAPIVAGRAIKYTTVNPAGVLEPTTGVTPGSRLSIRSLGNPSRGRVALAYVLPVAGAATLSVYDGAGRLVKQLVSGPGRAGTHRVVWDGTDVNGRKVGAGVYLVRLAASDKSVVTKATVVR